MSKIRKVIRYITEALQGFGVYGKKGVGIGIMFFSHP